MLVERGGEEPLVEGVVRYQRVAWPYISVTLS